MKLAFSVYDSAAEFFSNPIFQRSKGEAIRSFQMACTDERTAIHQAPEDYTLFYIGTFDDETGILTSERFEQLASGADVIPLIQQHEEEKAVREVAS